MHRSFHFIPAHKKKLFNKDRLLSIPADHYIFDLEDAVPIELKEESRRNILNFFENNTLNNCWIRTNEINSEEFIKDLKLIKIIKNIGIVIPKFQGNNIFYNQIKDYKKILLIENFISLNNLTSFNLPEKTFAIGLGLEDMLVKFPQDQKTINELIKSIKLQFIKNVKMYDILAIDGVFTDIKDNLSFKNDCENSKSFGFDAKLSIHPTQIKIINDCFKIDKESIKWAKNILSLCNGKRLVGYQIVDNTLITPPKLEKAKTILKISGE